MAIPRLTGYGYGRAASFQMHAASLGSLAGMDLPEFGYHGESGALSQPSGVRGAPHTPMATASAGRGGPGTSRGNAWNVPQLHDYPSSRAAIFGGIQPLPQGRATMAAVPGMVSPSAQQLAQGRQARSQLWQQAKGALTPSPELAPIPAHAGYRALSTPAPSPQLALPRGPVVMGRVPPPGANEPMSRSGLGTWPTVEKPPPVPEAPGGWSAAIRGLTGDWGEPDEPHPPTQVTSPVGAATPSTRAPESRADAFAPAQTLSSELFPGDVPEKEEPETPQLPTLQQQRGPRSRRGAFNPNQGMLPGF